MPANDKQIAGTHYKTETGIQPWDYFVGANVPFLEASAAKYLLRYKKKGGKQDLEKALHFIEKRIECVRAGFGIDSSVPCKRRPFNELMDAFDVADDVRMSIGFVMHWRREEHLIHAAARVKKMIDDAENTEKETAKNNNG